MRIDRFRLSAEGGRARASAVVSWEDRPRAPFELFFESEGPAAGEMAADPNAFLLACVHVASWHREKRVLVDGAICPVLRDGLSAADQILALWWGPRHVPALEPSAGFRAPRPAPAREGLFFSGGVDSFDMLVHNRERFPPDHPGAFREGLHVVGLPYTADPSSPTYRNFFARACASASAVARTLDLPLTFVRTNLAELEPEREFYRQEQFGIAFASVAHLFSRRFTAVSFASQLEIPNGLAPLGSHPFLDPNYRTAALEFRNFGSERTRLDKVRAIAPHRDALRSLMTCHVAPLDDERFNCGRCEKCLRTMAEFALAGALDAIPYPADALTPEALAAITIEPDQELYWNPLAAGFRTTGREDLSGAILAALASSRRAHAWAADAGWRGRMRRLDRRFFGSRVTKAVRAVRRRRAAALPGGAG